MGIESSKEDEGNQFLKDFYNKYSFFREIQDKRFGEIQVYF
jgi:hypothetical protein